MKAPKINIYSWEKENSTLKKVPWDSLQNGHSQIEFHSAKKLDSIRKQNEDYIILLAEVDKEKDLDAFSNLTNIDISILYARPEIFSKAQKLKTGKLFHAVHRFPAYPVEVLSFLQLAILFLYYHFRCVEVEREEMDWLRKIENVFEFSRAELLEKDKEIMAFQNLVEYENRLLEEQKRINEALMALQEFRDKEQKQWEAEKQAREKLVELQSGEIKEQQQILKAQENLLEFNRQKQIAYQKLLDRFEKEGTLSKEDIKKLFEEHKLLLEELSKMSSL
ncbi:MAG: hypothetical protein D6767_00665 [Candidatus Hydrogenedentota bacterium]|nr:MAG: hypothetical protein D6767_00665 [Candidatus Hydrogenedentota bacterium]